jgi:transcriptional antiterminator RfaH
MVVETSLFMDSIKRWYAVYTKSRAEKKVAEQLTKNEIENYLPLQKTLRQWSDRRKFIFEPLFRSYIFVKVDNTDYLKVLGIAGTVGYVSIAHKKIPIPDCQIDAIKTYLGELIINSPINYFQKGDDVEIIYGPLKGLCGYLINNKNDQKLIVQLNAINQNITLTLPSHLIQKIKSRSKLLA